MDATVAVVGCGRWGTVHLNNLLEMKRIGLIGRVVACDLSEKTTQSFLDSDAQYNTWQSMCEHETLDLIVLATPNNTHYPLGMALLDKGIKTLIEKPFAPTSAEATNLLQQAKANQTAVFCGHLLRHHPGVIRMSQVLLEDQIGNPTSILYRRTSLREKPESCLEFSTLTSGINPQVTGRIEVAWEATQECRDIHIKGDNGAISLNFGQHENLQLNGIDIELNPPSNPLSTQILACLACDTMTSKQESDILSTVVNMERVKACTTR